LTCVIFLGTPEFAVPSLEELVNGGFDVATVVTQPDRPTGRGGAVTPPAVKIKAMQLGLPVLQPESLRDPVAIDALRALAPDLIAVAAYGQILRRAVLDLPRFGCLNVHPSLLPKLRGASPIQTAIRQGHAETGVTIMLMNARMDAGPILAQVSAPIEPRDTAASLGDRLARVGATLLVDTIPRWEAGQISPKDQDEAQATYCKPLVKEDANIDWSRSADEIDRQCRANTPWPGCQTFWDGRQIRLVALRPLTSWSGPDAPGTVVLFDRTPSNTPRLGVATGHGAVEITQLQLAGKRAMSAAEFLRGQPTIVGARLESA
jgi:methionyl-tRNA formyltransferase